MSLRACFFLISICALFLGLDIGLKRYVVSHISAFHGVSVFQNWLGVDFSLEYVKNTGAAWGFLSSLQNYLLWGRCVIILALLGYIFFSSLSTWRKGFLGLIVTGAFGNVLDYFIYGHVVDMFHFRFWGHSFAVFNVADSIIFCGVVFLFFCQSREKRIENKV